MAGNIADEGHSEDTGGQSFSDSVEKKVTAEAIYRLKIPAKALDEISNLSRVPKPEGKHYLSDVQKRILIANTEKKTISSLKLIMIARNLSGSTKQISENFDPQVQLLSDAMTTQLISAYRQSGAAANETEAWEFAARFIEQAEKVMETQLRLGKGTSEIG